MLTRALALIAAAAIVPGGVRAAAADGTSTAAEAQDGNRRDASVRARRGVALYKLGRFLEAIDEFEQAYLLFPSDALLYNLGQSHRQLDHCKEALEYYRKFLEGSADSPLAPKVRALLPPLEKACEVKLARPVEVDSSAGAAAAPPVAARPIATDDRAPRAAVATARDDAGDRASAAAPVIVAAAASAAPIIHVRAALGAGVLSSGGAAAAPIGPVITATRAILDGRAELGGRVGIGLFAGDPGTTARAVELLAFAGRTVRRGATSYYADGGAGVVVLSGLPRGLAAQNRAVHGSFAVPQLAALAGLDRALDDAWTIGVGAELGVGPSAALRGGAAVTAVVAIGIGYRR
ncbi:MAG: tetratricopeptide repeat protein [Deltaproteobacteria bacterium]|nr:tetratricopeptide repeat protein [Deltaproteobacteria bacterium]